MFIYGQLVSIFGKVRIKREKVPIKALGLISHIYLNDEVLSLKEQLND